MKTKIGKEYSSMICNSGKTPTPYSVSYRKFLYKQFMTPAETNTINVKDKYLQ